MLSNFLSVLAMTGVEPLKAGTVMGLVTIDWTLLFQIINTIALFLLLRHFLFKPVKEMIEKRQNMIADQLDDAQTKNVDAEKLIAQYDDKLQNIEEKGRQMIREAALKAESRASEIIKDAEKDAELIKKRAEKEIGREKLKAVNELKEDIVSLSLLAASKVLEKDIDQNQHKALINQFLDEVGGYNMAKLVSKTYASALYELALEEQMIDQILAEYEFVANSFDEFPEFSNIINSPKVSVDDKKKIIGDTYGKQVSELLINFLSLLIDKKRSDVMVEVYGDYKTLVEAQKGLVVAKVESVIPLEANEIKNLEAKLNQVTGKTVTVNNVINPDIMGGLVVKVGDKVIDGSIKRKLENLKHELAEIII